MSPVLMADQTEFPDAVLDDAELELDMRVVESTTRIAIMMCSTSDGCGSSCSTSACSTASNDPV
jgi:FxLD family lantipeptide